MTDISKLREMLERVESATGPDREIDCALAELFGLVDEAHCKSWCAMDGRTDITREMFVRAWSKHYTESIDAAVALCERLLLGWGWSVCRCCVSDDARVWPDYNSPEHGERLRREFPLPAERYPETNARGATELTWGPYDEGFDIDRRPPGNVALALCQAILEAKIYIAEQAEA